MHGPAVGLSMVQCVVRSDVDIDACRNNYVIDQGPRVFHPWIVRDLLLVVVLERSLFVMWIISSLMLSVEKIDHYYYHYQGMRMKLPNYYYLIMPSPHSQ